VPTFIVLIRTKITISRQILVSLMCHACQVLIEIP